MGLVTTSIWKIRLEEEVQRINSEAENNNHHLYHQQQQPWLQYHQIYNLLRLLLRQQSRIFYSTIPIAERMFSNEVGRE